MNKTRISRRAFLKGAGASAAGVVAARLLGLGVFASGEPQNPSDGNASQGTEKFVYRPYWAEKNIKTALGGEILFFGDIHDMEDDYFFYDAATGETRGVFSYLASQGKRPGLYASVGDYLQESSDITKNADAYQKSVGCIRDWAGEEAVIVSVMGNHENKTAAADGLNGAQVFEKTVGNNNYGLVARGVAPEDREKTLYYVVAFGCAHTQEMDETNTRAGARNKYWVNPEQIAALDDTLASIYGKDGTKNQGIPTFIDAHLPVHYFTSERCAENNCDLLTVLNKYPYVVYVWGHNHSEKDPGYGTVKLHGNTIVPNGSLDDLNADGTLAAREIAFTYISCGAVRGNQISDHTLEDSERALYTVVDGSSLFFEYCGRNGEVFDRTAYTDLREMTYFEDFRTLCAISAAGLTVDLAEEADMSVVRRGDFFLKRPVAGAVPGAVRSFSDRYATEVQWLTGEGAPQDGEFRNDESYILRLTLSSDTVTFDLDGEDVYLFDMSGVAVPMRYIEDRSVSVDADGHRAVIDIRFIPTAVMAEQPIPAVGELSVNQRYIIASDTEQYLFTRSRADCIAQDGKLLTVPDTEHYWMFDNYDDGFAMRSASGMYLTAALNGMNVVLVPVEELSEGVYTKWSFREGKLSILVDTAEYFLSYSGGKFALLRGDSNACQLYALL